MSVSSRAFIIIVLFVMAAHPSVTMAQRAAQLRVGVENTVARASRLRVYVAAPSRRQVWRARFGVGGAVVGAATMALFVVKHCDAGCRDDGGMYPGLIVGIPIGGVLGAAVGALVGASIDRRGGASP